MHRQRKVLSPERGNCTQQNPQLHPAEEGTGVGACTGRAGSAPPGAVLVDRVSQAELKDRLMLETVPAVRSFTGHGYVKVRR